MTTHPIDTEALRRLADQATPGPWRLGEAFPYPASWVAYLGEDGWDERTTVTSEDSTGLPDQEERDAAFIAAARTAVPALLDALEQAEADRDWNLRSSRMAKEERIKANARAERAEARIKAVRELHVYENRPVEKWARGHRFTGEHCAHDGEQWPCRTIRALDGSVTSPDTE